MTVSKANVVLDVTNPLVKADLKQRLVEAFGAISKIMKWRYPIMRHLSKIQSSVGCVVWCV